MEILYKEWVQMFPLQSGCNDGKMEWQAEGYGKEYFGGKRMQKALELKEMIEQERNMLDQTVEKYGLKHEAAYEQSKKLDDLIARYYEA